MSKWITEFELEDGDTMPEHMDLEYKGVRIDFHCKPQESTTKNDLGVDCNNCKNNFHRGDRTSYCATGDGMCHYECEDPILDKIRAEIEPTRKMYLEMNDIDWLNGCDYVLSVLDKYKAESEV